LIQHAVREEVNVIVQQERLTTHYKRDGGIWELPVAFKMIQTRGSLEEELLAGVKNAPECLRSLPRH
jgi:hypothetical protein